MALLKIALLGSFQVWYGGQPVTVFESSKVRALLAYLSVESGRPHSRESLAALLWPDWPDSSARNNLRYALSNLRFAIHDSQASPPFLHISRDQIAFNPASDYQLDVADFNSGADLLKSRLLQPEPLEAAVALYQGDFLSGVSAGGSEPFEEWALLKREQLQRCLVEMLFFLSKHYEERGEFKHAEVHARRLVELETWNEEAHLQLMRVLALSGQRSAALAQYEICRRTLARELRVEPAHQTVESYEAIRSGTLSATIQPRAPADETPPYKGMAYFEEADAGWFFGREALTARMLERIQGIQPGEARFLGVVGASGSGKSSLLRAGVAPAFKGQVIQPANRPDGVQLAWQVVMLTPTAHPIEALSLALLQARTTGPAIPGLGKSLRENPQALQHSVDRLFARVQPASLIEDGWQKQKPALLLVIDQFEEVFTSCQDEAERRAFVDCLNHAAGLSGGEVTRESSCPVFVLISLRADYYAACAPYPALRQALAERQEFIGPMQVEELRQAIEEPARLGGWELETGLVELLLHDIGADSTHAPEHGALPLLSHAMLETWQRRKGRRMTISGYIAAGGVSGSIANTAENTFTHLSPEEQEIARNVFLRLADLTGGIPHRRLASLDELRSPEELEGPPEGTLQSVIAKLVAARLLITYQETIQLSHEALIQEWTRLRHWLEEDQEELRLHHHLAQSSQAWEALGGDPGELYRGARLARALEWSQEPRNAGRLNSLEMRFLAASHQADQSEAMERENQRQRQLQAAQELADAQRQQAEIQAQANLRLRRRAIYLGSALFLALGFALLAALLSARNANLANLNSGNAALAATRQAQAQAASTQAIAEAQRRATQQAIAQEQAGLRATALAVAERQAQLAFIHELAQASISNLTVDPERSLLLALQAAEVAETTGIPAPVDLQGVMHQAIQADRAHLTLLGHTNWVSKAVYSPDGRLLATISEDGTARIWEASTGKSLLTLSGHKGFLWDVAFRADGEQLITTGMDKTARVWDVRSGEILHILDHGDIVELAVSPDGRWFATFSSQDFPNQGDRIKVWEFGSGMLYRVLSGTAAAFSLDGTLLAYGNSEGTVILLEVAGGREIRRCEGLAGPITRVVFSPDGKQVIASTRANLSRAWEVEGGQSLFDLEGQVLGYSPDGSILATSSGINRTSLTVWQADTGQYLYSLSGFILVSHAFSPDGSHLATGSQDGSIRVWEAATGEPVFSLYGNAGAVHGVAFSPVCSQALAEPFASCGENLAVTFRDGSVKIWDVSPAGDRELLTAAGFTGYFFPDGDHLQALVYQDTFVEVQTWDLSEVNNPGLETSLQSPAHDTSVIFGVCNPESPQCATASVDGVIKIWEPISGHKISEHTLPVRPEDSLMGLVFTDQGLQAGFQALDFSISIWDVEHEKRWLTLTGSNVRIGSIAINRDGSLIAAGSLDDKLTEQPALLWDARDGRLLRRLEGHSQLLYGVEFSLDGKRLATISLDGTARVWDTASGEMQYILVGHAGSPYSVDFSPDGKWLATGSIDKSTKIWDIDPGSPTEGQDLLTLSGHTGFIQSVFFSPDGKRLASGSFGDGTVRVYTLDWEELVAVARSRVSRGLALQECQKYLHLYACP